MNLQKILISIFQQKGSNNARHHFLVKLTVRILLQIMMLFRVATLLMPIVKNRVVTGPSNVKDVLLLGKTVVIQFKIVNHIS